MISYIIKTHKKDTYYTKPHFFLLNKGMNSGKPQDQPFTNSFVIILEKQEDYDTVFWTAYALFKAKYWQYFLCGSVIPFLRLNDFKKEFSNKLTEEFNNLEQHKKEVQALRLLIQKEDQFHQNLQLINDMKKAIIYRYYKR